MLLLKDRETLLTECMQNDSFHLMKNRAYQRGVSLVETIIALVILSTIGVALMALNVQIQSATNSSRSKSFAESQAQKMIEQARNQRKINGGVAGLPDGCYADGNMTPGSGSCVCGTTGAMGGDALPGFPQFKTYVKISTLGAGKEITANVGWKDKSRNVCTKIITVLYDY